MAFGRRLVARAVCVPLLLVGGCADDPEPKLAPPDDTPTTASSSPSASPTREPWEKKTNAGAVAFIHEWVKTLNKAGSNGETERLRSLSETSCASCSNLIQYIGEVYGGGGRIVSRGWAVLSVGEFTGERSPSERSLPVQISQAPQRVHRPGEDVARVPARKFTVAFDLQWTSGGWRTSKAEVLQ